MAVARIPADCLTSNARDKACPTAGWLLRCNKDSGQSSEGEILRKWSKPQRAYIAPHEQPQTSVIGLRFEYTSEGFYRGEVLSLAYAFGL